MATTPSPGSGRSSDDLAPDAGASHAPLVELLPEPALLVDAVGTVLAGNQAAAALLGRPIEELLGTSALEVVHPEDQGMALEALDSTAEGAGAHDPITIRVVDAGGAARFVEVMGNNLLHDARVGAIVLSARDLEERARSDEDFASLGRRFEITFEHSPVGRALVSLDGRITRANRAICQMTGLSAEELVGTNVFELAHPDEIEIDREMGAAISRGDLEVHEGDRRLRHVDGSWRWIRRTVFVISDASGAPQYVSLDVVDVTELREVADGQQRAEAQLRALLDASSEIVTVLDPDGTWRWTSGAIERLLGYDAARDPTAEGGVFAIVHPDDAELAARAFEVLASRPPGPGRSQDDALTVRLRAANGEWRWFEVRGRNLIDDPAVNGIVLLSRDITDLREAQAQLSHQATHDPLTKLPNRVLFQELGDQALARADRDGTLVAVLFLDLDRFKRVNDTYGHQIGDALLVEVAQRLRNCVRRGDVVARFGGDEFVILCEHPAGQLEMLDLANRLIASVAAPTEIPDIETEVGVSVGISIGAGGRVTVDALLRDADAALYQAKDLGRDQAVIFGAHRVP